MCVLGRSGPRVVSLSTCFRGGVWGVKYCWNSTGYTGDGGYENRNTHFFNNNEINCNEVLMLVILNCTLLHNQNGGWTVPYTYLMVCSKNAF